MGKGGFALASETLSAERAQHLTCIRYQRRPGSEIASLQVLQRLRASDPPHDLLPLSFAPLPHRAQARALTLYCRRDLENETPELLVASARGGATPPLQIPAEIILEICDCTECMLRAISTTCEDVSPVRAEELPHAVALLRRPHPPFSAPQRAANLWVHR